MFQFSENGLLKDQISIRENILPENIGDNHLVRS